LNRSTKVNELTAGCGLPFDQVAVGDAIRSMASLPLDANAQFLTLMATKMPFVGRG
jgi:hypothetical protein